MTKAGGKDVTTAVQWKDPPPRERGHGAQSKWLRLLTPLMEQPRRWALVKDFWSASAAYSTGCRLHRGTLKRPPGRWEFTARKTDTGAELYARYLGPEEPAAAKLRAAK